VALRAYSFVGTLQPTLAPTVVYILCLRDHSVGGGACGGDLGLNLTKRGLAVPAAADRDSKWPASGVAFFWGSSFNDGITQTVLDPLVQKGAGSHPLRVQTMVGVH
jgi:hypothetical protein